MVLWEHLQCTRSYGVVGTSTMYSKLWCCGNIYSVLEVMVLWEHLQCTRSYVLQEHLQCTRNCGVVGTSTMY
jgi:hypothetical protein